MIPIPMNRMIMRRGPRANSAVRGHMVKGASQTRWRRDGFQVVLSAAKNQRSEASQPAGRFFAALRMTRMGIFRHTNLSSNEVKEWDAPKLFVFGLVLGQWS